MQTALLLQVFATVCACVARAAPLNATLTSTNTTALVEFDLFCSDDPLGYACRHACSCSQNSGQLLCPKYLPDTEGVPGTHCSSDKTPPYADCICESRMQCRPPRNLC
ncbi:MAG: hypothetical protein J3R72DRAFT_448513 [Linnemannia gamsii]|nr:MAG: hypothetical protein J3R72DRAFT_448513 [Linnemannia gamsii]